MLTTLDILVEDFSRYNDNIHDEDVVEIQSGSTGLIWFALVGILNKFNMVVVVHPLTGRHGFADVTEPSI